MQIITDEYMRQMLATKNLYPYDFKPSLNIEHPELRKIIWEHGRRNFELRAERQLSIVGPVTEDADIDGFGIFSTDIEATKKITEGDPAVIAGIFIYFVYPVISLPGDSLPK